jgi:orotate phosphoribosyltransferase
MSPDAQALLGHLVRLSYFREQGKQFRLASGRLSDYYIECSLTTTHPHAMPLIGKLVHGLLPAEAVAVGGPTMGADPIAAAAAYYSAGTSQPVAWFSVRKAAKEHGATRWLEGTARAGDAIVVVEDVITSGGSVIDAVRKCREEGLRVLRAVVLVDREEDDGRARVEAALRDTGADFRALFRRSDLEKAWQGSRATSR